MKIGIDLDGVVFDSEKDFRIYSELYDIFDLKRNSTIDKHQVRFQERLNWTEEEQKEFLERYHAKIVKESNYMPGAKMILKMLKEEGHELVVITARGGFSKEIKTLTEERLKLDDMNIFDNCYYAIKDKGEICEKENVDVMIDDLPANCKGVADRKIKAIYLKDAPSYDMEENEYVKVLYNWGEIYRYIKEMQN